MNPISLLPRSHRRRLAVGALLALGLVAPLLTRGAAEPGPESKTQPVYLAYTTNNMGYLYTCG